MNLHRKFTSTWLTGMLLVIFCMPGFSQFSNTMYFMKNVPQANLLNPAFQPECNFYLGFPGMSPFQFNIGNSSLSMHDILFYDASIDSTITFLHPNANKDAFLAKLSSQNSLSFDMSSNIGALGFRAGQMFFSFNVAEKAFARFIYPKDLFTLPIYFALDRKGDPSKLDLSGFGANVSAYSEWSMGVSRKFGDALTLGIRGKLLFGQVNLTTSESKINIQTSFDQPWQISSDFRADASIPFIQIPDSAGKFDFNNVSFPKIKVRDIENAVLLHPNLGLGLDLGLIYQPVSTLSLSVSVLDLGYIGWKHNNYNVLQNASFEFKGVDMTNFINGSDTSGIGTALLDSLKNSFDFTYLREKYRTTLPTQVFFGGQVGLTKGISFGALAHLEIFEKQVQNEVTVSGNFKAGKFLALSLSYSLIHNNYNDVGLGLAFKPGPFHLYVIFDNIPTTFSKDKSSGIPIPVYMKGFNMRIGMNLIFGCNKDKKINKDIPLVE